MNSSYGIFFLAAIVSACSAELDPAADAASRTAPRAAIVTLRSFDELTGSYGFERATHGFAERDGTYRNRSSDIMYDAYGEKVLAVGMENSARGVIVDLGDLRRVGSWHSLFHAVHREGNAILVEDVYGDDAPDRSIVLPASTGDVATVPASIGHIYAVRIDRAASGTADQSKEPSYYLLRVVEHAPGASVTFRWRSL